MNLSSHRCATCQSYVEVAFRDAMSILEICPVCLDSVAIITLPVPTPRPVGEERER